MAATKERLQDLNETGLDLRDETKPQHGAVTTSEPVAPASQTKTRSAKRWGLGLVAAWVVGVASLSFEPAPSGNVEPLLWADVLVGLFYLAVLATLLDLPDARPRSFKLSGFAGALGVVLGLGCLITQHHGGLWPYYEVVAFGGLACASLLALRRS